MTKITLKEPVEFDGKKIDSIEIGEPHLGGLGAYEEARAAGSGHRNALAALLAFEFGWPVSAAQRLCSSDVAAIEKEFAGFFYEEASGGTGAPPSPSAPTSSDGATAS